MSTGGSYDQTGEVSPTNDQLEQRVRSCHGLYVAAGLMTADQTAIAFQPRRRDRAFGIKPWSMRTADIRDVRVLQRWRLPLGGLLATHRVQLVPRRGYARTLIVDDEQALADNLRKVMGRRP